MKRPTLLLTALLAVSVSPLLCAQAADSAPAAPQAAPNPAVMPDAQAVLNRMTASLGALQTFSITSDSTRDEVMALGYKLQNNEHAVLTVRRPDKLRVDLSGDMRDRTFVYDGARLAMYSPDDAAFTRIEAPGTLKELIGGMLDAGIEMPLIDVLYQAVDGTLTDAVESGILVGQSTINGVDCDQLAFRQASIDWQLWVQRGASALPRKLLITTRYEVGAPQFQSLLTWNLDPAIDKATFVFSPPSDAREISFSDPAAFQASAGKGE